MNKFCGICGVPLADGQPHKKDGHTMSWFTRARAATDACDDSDREPPIEPPYQANESGDFFCSICGWSPLASWSHDDCEIQQLEQEN